MAVAHNQTTAQTGIIPGQKSKHPKLLPTLWKEIERCGEFLPVARGHFQQRMCNEAFLINDDGSWVYEHQETGLNANGADQSSLICLLQAFADQERYRNPELYEDEAGNYQTEGDKAREANLKKGAR